MGRPNYACAGVFFTILLVTIVTSNMAVAIKKQFTALEVKRLTGFKLRMLDYLLRQGLLLPTAQPNPGRGKDRLYNFNDVVLGRALNHLLRCGISVSKLKRALEALRSLPEITPTALPGKYLVTNGSDIFFTNRKDVFVDVNKGGQLAFAFVIGVRGVRADVLKGCRALGESSQKRAS